MPAAPESEFGLIARLAPYLVGAGDDAAVLDVGGRHLCVAVDVLVEDVHFRRDLSSLPDVGWKALAVNVSDLAAMGATPRAAVIGLQRPDAVTADDVVALYDGMAEAARRWGLDLVGGDTVRAPVLAVSVTVLGEAARPVLRSGARPGDKVVVIGALGASAAALAMDRAGQAVPEALLAAHRRPRALVAAGQVLAGHGATAMIDVSDGLGADLGHVARASGVALRIDRSALPVAPATAWAHAISGGDDYALAATLPAGATEAAVAEASAADDVAGAVVGTVHDGQAEVLLTLPDGSVADITTSGFDHYREQP